MRLWYQSATRSDPTVGEAQNSNATCSDSCRSVLLAVVSTSSWGQADVGPGMRGIIGRIMLSARQWTAS